MQKKRILLIEDEEDIRDLIALQADLSGYKLLVAADGQTGYRTIERERPDIVVLDIMLPGKTGLDLCKKIKNSVELKYIPIIFLSAKGEESDIILGLELGADDYVPKPFSPKILFSRIKAILRRRNGGEKVQKPILFDDFTLEIDRYILRKKEKLIPLTLSEFGILKRLITYRGRVFTRNQLIEELHNDEGAVTDRNVDVHIASLRKKMGPSFSRIETVRGIGYRFCDME
ncbi:MAG: response regulator transcription factor [Verrucomicrobiota bacterium]|nr:response regulator transcription factor [Verrucomicrobiota bacterium]